MKIMFTDPFDISNFMGGSQKSLFEVMKGMKGRNHRVMLATPGKKGLLTKESKDAGIECVHFFLPALISTRIVFLGKRYFNFFAAFYNLGLFLLSSISMYRLLGKIKPDIVHSNQMVTSIAVGIACKARKIPCVWHIRENPADHILAQVIKAFGFVAYLLSDRIMVNSQYTASIFRHTRLKKKISIVPIGINLQHIPKPDEGEDEMEVPGLIKKVSIIGRIIPMKGHRTLFAAIKHLKAKKIRCQLNILGHYDPEDIYYKSLIKYAKESGISDRVVFRGFSTNIASAMYETDILVSSSNEAETFGRTLVEAMAFGKPVVATRVGAHPEIIDHGVTGFLVEKDNPEELADRISKLLTDNKLAREIGLNGKSKYNKEYTLEKYCNRIETVYESLLVK